MVTGRGQKKKREAVSSTGLSFPTRPGEEQLRSRDESANFVR